MMHCPLSLVCKDTVLGTELFVRLTVGMYCCNFT